MKSKEVQIRFESQVMDEGATRDVLVFRGVTFNPPENSHGRIRHWNTFEDTMWPVPLTS